MSGLANRRPPACSLARSGITGGKFLERGKVYKPGNKLVRAATLPRPVHRP